MSSESKVTIKIPRALYRRIRGVIDGSGFDSVTDFVVYVLRDIASSSGMPSKGSKTGEDSIKLTAQEIQMIKERLKNLGYL